MYSLMIIVLFFSLSQPIRQSKFFGVCTFTLPHGIQLQLKASRFHPTQHRVDSCQVGPDEDPWVGVCLIDAKPIFGTDWDMPRTVLDEAYVVIGKDKVYLDVSCMYNPWNSSADRRSFSADKIEGGYIITGHFSDGAGTYDAEWLVVRGQSVRVKLQTSGW